MKSFSAEEVGLAVLGWPIKHSISPYLHNEALDELSRSDSRFNGWSYERLEVPAEELPFLLPQLAQNGYRGINLTIPHKVEVLPHLSEIDPEAEIMGAVNTLQWFEGGWKGYNTDGYGLQRALETVFDIELQNCSVLILGAGGAARAAAARCLAKGCTQVCITNRSADRLAALISDLRAHFPESDLRGFPLDDLPKQVLNISNLIVINATSLGLQPEDPPPIDLSFLKLGSETRIYDMIYNPPQTALLKDAKAEEMNRSNGLSMLVFQALRSLEIWSGREVSAEAMFEGAKKGMREIAL